MRNRETNNKMIGWTPSIIIFITNVSNLSIPIKRQNFRLDKRMRPICCLQEINFNYNNIDMLKGKNGNIYTMKLLSAENWSYSNIGQSIFIRKKISMDKEVHYIVIKGQFSKNI